MSEKPVIKKDMFLTMPKEELIAFLNKYDSYTKHSNVKILEMGEGYSKTVMAVDESCLNFMGHIHGGALMTMADVTGGTSIAHNGKFCVTINATSNFISAACPGNIYGYGRQVGVNGNLATSDVEIKDCKDRLVYKGTVTMYLLD